MTFSCVWNGSFISITAVIQSIILFLFRNIMSLIIPKDARSVKFWLVCLSSLCSIKEICCCQCIDVVSP